MHIVYILTCIFKYLIMYNPITLYAIVLLHSLFEEKSFSRKLITTCYLFIFEIVAFIPLEIIVSIDNSISTAEARYGF